jgi:hypothetical protein
MVGSDYSKELNGRDLSDSFTSYLMNAWHITLKEFRAGSRGEREAISKKIEAWISDDTVSVRAMYQAAFTMPNHFFVTASSNADDAASITNADRKWAIAEMKGGKLTAAETKWIFKFLGSRKDGADPIRAGAKLRGYFSTVDLSTFNPDASAPFTKDKAAMIATNISNDVEWLVVMFEQRNPPFDRDVVLTEEVTREVHKRSPMKPSMHRVAKLLSQPPINGKAIQFRVGDKRYRGVIVRNYEMWRYAQGKLIMDHIEGTDAAIADALLA